MYRTILVPLDLTAADHAALRHVRALAPITGARVVLIHVADGWAARNRERFNLADSEEILNDRAALEAHRAQLASCGVVVAARLEAGEPADHILRAADEEHADLIVMATHGHGPVMDAILGSVSDAVKHRARTPVLLIRAENP